MAGVLRPDRRESLACHVWGAAQASGCAQGMQEALPGLLMELGCSGFGEHVSMLTATASAHWQDRHVPDALSAAEGYDLRIGHSHLGPFGRADNAKPS